MKRYIDELIVKQGILHVENPDVIVEKVKIDFLVKLAFRFYGKLYRGDVPHIYLNQWEWFRCTACETPCEAFKHFTGSNDENREIPRHCPLGRNSEATIHCCNCGNEFVSLKPENKQLYMPLCDECVDVIGEEMEIWGRLFD